MQVIIEWFYPVNLPVTCLLILCAMYWLMVLFGLFGMDFLDFDIDLDVEVDGSFEASDVASAGLWSGFFRFMHVDKIPFMVVFSIFSFVFWMSLTLFNHTWNPDHDSTIALIAFIAFGLGSVGLTKLILQPMLGFFEDMEHKAKGLNEHVGDLAIVETFEVTDKFGEAKIHTGESPVVVQVRNPNRFALTRGDQVELCAFHKETGSFEVRPADAKKKPEDGAT